MAAATDRGDTAWTEGPGGHYVGTLGTLLLGVYLIASTVAVLVYLPTVFPSCDPGKATPVATTRQSNSNQSPAEPTLSIASVSPSSGLISGSEPISIIGSGFAEGAGVRFGGVPAEHVTVDSERLITAITPRHAAGVVDIIITTEKPVGVQTRGTAFTFVCPAVSEEVMMILVIAAGALGALVHAMRSYFWYVGSRQLVLSWVPMYVLLPFTGGALAFAFYLIIRAGLYTPSGGTSFLLVGLAALVGMFSAQATEKLKKIAEGVFTDVKPGADHVAPKPAVRSIDPKSGPAAGRTTVTIAGQGFSAGTEVRFGESRATDVAVVDERTLRVKTPAGRPGPVDVAISVPNAAPVIVPAAFTYTLPVRKVSAIEPTEGVSAGGTVVKVTGENFETPVAVLFGDRPSTDARVIDARTIEAKTPAHPAGPVDVRVEVDNQPAGILKNGYTYRS